MATISFLANTLGPSVHHRSDDTAFGAGTFSWQDPVHSWRAGPGEVMTVENKQTNRNDSIYKWRWCLGCKWQKIIICWIVWHNLIGIDLLWRQKGIIFFWTNAYKNGHCGQAGNVLWVHAELFFCTFDGYFCILYVCSQLELYQGHLREQSTRIKTFSVSLMINMFDIELKCIFLQKKSACILD